MRCPTSSSARTPSPLRASPQLRSTEREYGFSLLACFEVIESPPGLERGPPSPQHSADTSRAAFALQLRRTEREYGFSLLACFEVIGLRRVIQQASGLRHTRAPPSVHAGTGARASEPAALR